LSKTDDEVSKYIDARESHFKVLVSQYYLMVLFKVIIVTGLLAIGGVLVMNQEMNIGQFVASEIIILLIMGAIEKMIMSIEVIYDVLTSLEKIGQVTDMELESETGINMAHNIGEKGLQIELDGVSFSFPEAKDLYLRDVNLFVDSGEHVMIYSDNDVTSNALMAVIAGLYQPNMGAVAYNGLASGSIELGSLRSIIGDSLMKEVIFHGSVFDNISMGRKGIGYNEVLHAAKSLNLMEDVQKMSHGFETIINPDASNYSKSVIQKILLARGIVDRPKLLLMRDVFVDFNSLDKSKVMNLILDTANLWTVIIDSHDHELAKKMDKVIVLKKGSLVAYGDYDNVKDLMK
jgi:ABC-type bacteriocin/lantibiotic exporter with double-glycine peptidase domain